jgi:hypothetical protein
VTTRGILNVEGNRLVLINAATGKELYAFRPTLPHGRTALAGLYATSNGGAFLTVERELQDGSTAETVLVALDAAGKPQWRWPLPPESRVVATGRMVRCTCVPLVA